MLATGATYFTHKGAIEHDDMIGVPDGIVVMSSGGVEYLVLRPLLADSWSRCRAVQRSSTRRMRPRS